MRTDTQHLIIIGLVIIALALVVKDQFNLVDGIAIGLIGFLSQKSLTDKQSEKIEAELGEIQ